MVARSFQVPLERGSPVFSDSAATSRERSRALEKRSRRTVVPGTEPAVGDGITDAVDTAKLSFVGW